MEVITNFLKEKCLYDRLKDRIKSNLKAVAFHPSDKVKPANEQLERFRSTQDGVLAMYLVWDALDTLKLTNTMYLFRHETGFDPSKIVNPHILQNMHELIKDRRHCDVIMEHTMNWYTRDYTPRTDKCCQHKLLLNLNKEVGIKRMEAKSTTPSVPQIIDKRNLLDGNASPVTVSIHLGDDDEKPKVIEIPRDTAAKNIAIYLKAPSTPPPPRKTAELTSENIVKISQGDADVSSDSTTTIDSLKTVNSGKSNRTGSRSRPRTASRSSNQRGQNLLGDENDEHGIRRGFRRSPSPSRSSLSLKGGLDGLKESCDSIDSISYVHNPELHALFKEELRKIKERNRRAESCSSERYCRMPRTEPLCLPPLAVCPPISMDCPPLPPVCPPYQTVCRKPVPVCPPQLRTNSVHEGETVLTGHLVRKHPRPTCPPPINPHCQQPVNPCGRPPSPPPRVVYSSHKPHVSQTPSVPHLVNQCAQANDIVNTRMCGNTLLIQPPHPRRSCGGEGREEPTGQCFNDQVRRGTEDLINSAERTRRYIEVMREKDPDTELLKCELSAGTPQKVCKLGFAQNISRRLDKLRNNENITKLGRLCGSLMQRPHGVRSLSQSPPTTSCHQSTACGTVARPRPHSHGRSCGPASAGDSGCNENYRPEVLSEFDGVN